MKKGAIKKGQITIFVILAIAIVAVLLLVFFGDRVTNILNPKTPTEQVRDCVNEHLKAGIDIMKYQGGSIEPENYYMYKGYNVDYVCYTEEDYKACVMQKPLLKQSIEQELKNYLEPRARVCLESVKTNLEDRDYQVGYELTEVNVDFVPNSVVADIVANLRITKDSTESVESVKVDMNSAMYNLIMIASSIANWEARYGDSESLNYMINYPNLRVEKKKQSEGTTIYILTDRKSGEQFMFASRSFALKPGI